MSERAEPTVDERRRAAAHVLLPPGSSVDVDVPDLDDDVRHHLVRVLRLADGEVVSVTDGAGAWRLTTVRVERGEAQLHAASPVVTEGRDRVVTIASAVPKGDRLDVLVQKCTELGADRIVLLDAARSIVRWKGDRATRQRLRLQRIADEATRQSRRVWRTEVLGPVPALEILPTALVADPGGAPLAASLGGDVTVAIGPEGGWTDVELEAAAQRVGLGPSVLRVETAAIAATTLCVAG